jgi:hypothetical protein
MTSSRDVSTFQGQRQSELQGASEADVEWSSSGLPDRMSGRIRQTVPARGSEAGKSVRVESSVRQPGDHNSTRTRSRFPVKLLRDGGWRWSRCATRKRGRAQPSPSSKWAIRPRASSRARAHAKRCAPGGLPRVTPSSTIRKRRVESARCTPRCLAKTQLVERACCTKLNPMVGPSNVSSNELHGIELAVRCRWTSRATESQVNALYGQRRRTESDF